LKLKVERPFSLTFQDLTDLVAWNHSFVEEGLSLKENFKYPGQEIKVAVTPADFSSHIFESGDFSHLFDISFKGSRSVKVPFFSSSSSSRQNLKQITFDS